MAIGYNFPRRLPRRSGVDSFPLNLTGGRRNYYTEMTFSRYAFPGAPSITNAVNTLGDLVTSDVANFLNPFSPITNVLTNTGYVEPSDANSVRLPIPMKLNDAYVLGWSDQSYTDVFSNFSLFGGGAFNQDPRNRAGFFPTLNPLGIGVTLGQIASPVTGTQINPFVFAYFERPMFKEFSFTWTLAPRNEQESIQIRRIVNNLRERSAPAIGGVFMRYPDIVNIRFFPDNLFNMITLKPCVITAVSLDNTTAGPSFFQNGAPTIMTLTVNLKEIELWSQNDFTGNQQEIDFLFGGIGDIIEGGE